MSTTEIRTITGNVVSDPELRYTPDGKAVTDVRIAVNYRAKTDDGEWVDAGNDYYDVPVWEREAHNVTESLRKGTRVTVTGTIYRRAWIDSDGQVRVTKKVNPTSPLGIALDFQTAVVTKNPRNGATDQ